MNNVPHSITQEEIKEAQSLINSKISCDKLTTNQLEIIGEYYMEQMHPGKAHEIMHQMMGLEEGSKREEQFHISMAKNIYCGEANSMAGMMYSGGMMNMMYNRGMMNGYYNNSYNSWNFTTILFNILLLLLIILVIIWIIKISTNKKK